jgi:hypothetical protein
MLPSIRDRLDVVCTPEPTWTGGGGEWRGLPCEVGRVQLWLPVQETFLLRAFSLLVLLPEREPPDWLPYVLLGTQFLFEYQAVVTLDCSAGTGQGQLRLP